MIEQDTIRLLRECDAGLKMGLKVVDDVMERVESKELLDVLNVYKDKQNKIDMELQSLLEEYKDDGKDPNFMAEKMAKIKSEFKLQLNETDNTIAELITDGCAMGVKSLSRYLNQYAAADEKSKDLTKRLIDLESKLSIDLRKFL